MTDQSKVLHELKTDRTVFEAVAAGSKTYELRRNDRNFQVGDELWLRETQYTGEQMKAGSPLIYTHREQYRRIGHVLNGPIYGLADGWAILSFAKTLADAPVAETRECAACGGTGRERGESKIAGHTVKWDGPCLVCKPNDPTLDTPQQPAPDAEGFRKLLDQFRGECVADDEDYDSVHCSYLYNEVLRAYAQAGQRDGWNPISTAPKDKQILMACQFDHEDDWRIKTGWWNDEIDEWHVLGASWTPTMWHAMPLAPGAAASPPPGEGRG